MENVDQVNKYVLRAEDISNEIRKALDSRHRAVTRGDFSEAYRLAKVVTTMAQGCEELDRRMWELSTRSNSRQQEKA